MPGSGQGAAHDRDHWLGTHEAASFLGVHRSTLHTAVRQGLVTPDGRTPGGHLRFSRATLAAFRAQLAQGSGTRGADHLAAERLLARLAHLLVTGVDGEEICQAAIAGLREALPGVEMCAVSVRAGDPIDRLQLRVVAQDRYPATAFADYARLHSTFKFATTDVLRRQVVAVCEDTASQPLPTGTAWLCRAARLGAYAIVPLRGHDEALGMLVCANHAARPFDKRELAYLQAVGDILATALATQKRHACLATHLAAGSTLIQQALGMQCGPQSATRVREVFVRLSGAAEVCVLGLGADLLPRHTRLRALASRATARDEPLHECWTEGGVLHTASAARVLVRDQARGALAALWYGERSQPAADHALLVAFAGAYLLALGLQ